MPCAEQEHLERSMTESKFGIRQDKEFLSNATEVCLFLVCLGLVNELRRLEAATKRGELTRRDLSCKARVVLAQLNETADATERFDIVMPVMGYGQFSPFFWRWFNWWDDYLKGLSLARLGHLARQARKRVQTVNGYRPENHWMNYRQTPAFSLIPG